MSLSEQELGRELVRAAELDNREAQQAALENVVVHADAGGHRRLAFHARRTLADAYTVGRQWDKAYPLLSRCLSEYDRDVSGYGPEEEYGLLEWFAFLAPTMAEFPEISLDQVDAIFNDLEQRFRTAGHNLRTVYAARRWVAQLICDWDQEQRWYQQWLAAGGPRPGNVWDFEAEIERLVRRGDDAQARQLAAPVLDGQRSFSEPPVPIQCLMLLPLARAGQFGQAARAYRGARRGMSGKRPYRYEYGGMLHEFCALTGNEWLGKEVGLSGRLLGFDTLNRPNGKMEYATSVAVLCRELVGVRPGRQGPAGREQA
ncbi:MAG: hypothetical protein J2O48_03990 [Solirubrobacterales bacterium]|nr:hypothetical protein [Solirubrobacterales bacterium]